MLNTDFSDINHDFEELNIKEEKGLIPSHQSVMEKTDDKFNLKLVQKKLQTCIARKRSIAETIEFQEHMLKKLKNDYAYYDHECEVLRTQIDLQTTIKYTGDKKNILLASMVKTLDKIESDLTEQQDMCLKSEEKHLPVEKIKTEQADIVKEDSELDIEFMSKHKQKHCCKLCGQGFAQLVSFKDHLKAHTGFSYVCDKCTVTRRFTSSKAYKKHSKWHDEGEQTFKCNVCGKKFEYMYRLKSHEATHNEPSLQCTVHSSCGKDGTPKKFTFKHELLLHEKYANKEKMFKCTTCDKLFLSPRTVRIHHHKNAHSGMRCIGTQ